MRALRTVVLAVSALAQLSDVARGDTEGAQCILGLFTQDIDVRRGMDVSGMRLFGCVFVGLDLRDAVFDNCDFDGARICQCRFENASFRNANFNGLQIGDCTFDKADFSGAIINGIERFDGRYGDDFYLTVPQFVSTYSYKSKKLSNCVIHLKSSDRHLVSYSLDFSDADLRDTIVRHVDLRNSDFSNARIRNMKLRMSTITVEQLMSTADGRQKVFLGIESRAFYLEDKHDLSDVEFYDSTLYDLLAGNVSLENVLLSRCEIVGGVAKGTLEQTSSYRRGSLTGLRFLRVNFRNVDLSRQNMTSCFFTDCDFQSVDFADAVISNTWIRRCDLTAEQIKSTWNYKNGRMSTVNLPDHLEYLKNSASQE